MADALASSLIDALLAVELGAAGRAASNRFSLEGVRFGSKSDGALEIGIRRLEAASVRLAFGPIVAEAGRLALRGLVGHVRVDHGKPRLTLLEAASAELAGAKVHGPMILSRELQESLHALHVAAGAPRIGDAAAADGAGSAWCLGPLAAADGRIRAEIVDAHLMFDADVTVPIGRGAIDFNEVTVEHVGPDSSMGVSRLGVYVDAPNGRSYVYQFASTPIGGVEFERRGGPLGAWVSNRGNLRLQPFVEGLLRQARPERGAGVTDEARQMLERTALSGDVQLSDGRFAVPGIEAHLIGRADGRNAVRLHSKAVGRGVTVEMGSLSARDAVLNVDDTRFTCDEVKGALVLRALLKGTDLRFEFDVPEIGISGLRVERERAGVRNSSSGGTTSAA